jgi:arabinose-5-phosphate isomerase
MSDSKPVPAPLDADRVIRLAHETLEIEAAAVLGLRQRIGDHFARAVGLMLKVPGRVVVMGMGKSGHIGR